MRNPYQNRYGSRSHGLRGYAQLTGAGTGPVTLARVLGSEAFNPVIREGAYGRVGGQNRRRGRYGALVRLGGLGDAGLSIKQKQAAANTSGGGGGGGGGFNVDWQMIGGLIGAGQDIAAAAGWNPIQVSGTAANLPPAGPTSNAGSGVSSTGTSATAPVTVAPTSSVKPWLIGGLAVGALALLGGGAYALTR